MEQMTQFTNSTYKVEFEFLNDAGDWVATDLTNNGKGFTQKEAEDMLIQLRTDSICLKRYMKITPLSTAL